MTKCTAADVDAAPAKHPTPCLTSTFLSNVAAKGESHGPAMKLIVPGELLKTTYVYGKDCLHEERLAYV
ncbi:MAG: hypothetical protein WAZ77_12500 [Candidatus Nitrosopolaris sp.]